MSKLGAFELLTTSSDEAALALAEQERKLKEAAFAVHKKFGNFLLNSQTSEEYDERFSYLKESLLELVGARVEPTPEVMSWIKEGLRPTFSTDKYDPHEDWDNDNDKPKNSKDKTKHEPGENLNHSSSVKNSTWQWDGESRSFKSSISSFGCSCGNTVSGVGQHVCHCGKIWNLSSITDGNKTASTPLFVCREVLRRNTILGKTADVDPTTVTDPMADNSLTNPVDTPGDPMPAGDTDSVQQTRSGKNDTPGYDLESYFGPAAGDDRHDEGGEERVKAKESSAHEAALKAIFGADDEEEKVDPTEEDAAPESTPFDNDNIPAEEAPEAPVEDLGPAPMENQGPPMGGPPMGGDPLEMAQQTILDVILQKKEEDVMGVGDTDKEQDLLEDAYQTLNTVKSLDAPAPASMGYDQGFVMGFFEGLSAGNSYEDRKTDYVGTEPPIPGISNGLDDAVPNNGKDTTPEFRSEFATQLDEDNAAGQRDEHPIDPGEPFSTKKSSVTLDDFADLLLFMH